MTDRSLPAGLEKAFVSQDGASCAVLVGKCDCDDEHFFPQRAFCPRCLSPLAVKAVGGQGRIYAFTTVRRRAPFGLPEPYAIGYVDLAQVPLRIIGLFAPESLPRLEVGAEVALKVMPLGADAAGKPCLRPVFEVKGDEHG